MSNSVVVVVAGDDKTGEVFNAVKKHLDETKRHAKETSESLGEIGEKLKMGLETAGIAVGAREVVEGFKRMIEGAMETAVQLKHLNQQTGISVENLSVLKYASQQTGIEFETLTKGFKKLAVTTYDAEHGSDKAAKGFEQLGITTAQLRAKGDDMYGVLALVADKFKAMPDGIEKSDTAAKIFGARMGSELIPLLNQGAAGIESFKAEAEAMGLVLDENGIEKMEELHKSLASMKGAFAGLGLEISTTLAPALETLANGVTHFLQAAHTSPAQTLKAMLGQGLMGTPLSDFGQWMMNDAAMEMAVTRTKPMTPAELVKWLREHPEAGKRPGGDDTGGGGGDKKKGEGKLITVDTSGADEENTLYTARFIAIMQAEQKRRAEHDAMRDAIEVVNPDVSAQLPLAVLKPLERDYSKLLGAGEKLGHAVFDPLFNLNMSWQDKWKATRDNLLRDIGELAESQLFKMLFGDPQGRGGKGWDGTSWEGNTENPRNGVSGHAGGVLGSLLGHFLGGGSKVTSNGGVGGGAGTVATAAASVMQTGKSVAGGVQVVLNNNGAPLEVSQAQHSADGEGQVVHILMKQLETNGPFAQAMRGMMGGII